MAGRGEFTDKIKDQMEKYLGREASQRELRLYPYIQNVMMDGQKIDPNHINDEERKILDLLREAGHIEGGASGLLITRDFWNFICAILFQTYVAHAEQ